MVYSEIVPSPSSTAQMARSRARRTLESDRISSTFELSSSSLRRIDTNLPPVRITLPAGTIITSQQSDLDEVLSKAVNRKVTLGAVDSGAVDSATEGRHARAANAEEYWPDMDGLDYRDTVTDFALPEGSFFDCATVHLLTTATLDQLRELYPKGRFEVRRFRPNIVVKPASSETGFAENAWIGHTICIGEIRLNITGPCPRCVMTTLPQIYREIRVSYARRPSTTRCTSVSTRA